MSLDDMKDMSDDREHVLKKRSTLDEEPSTKHLLEKRILFNDKVL